MKYILLISFAVVAFLLLNNYLENKYRESSDKYWMTLGLNCLTAHKERLDNNKKNIPKAFDQREKILRYIATNDMKLEDFARYACDNGFEKLLDEIFNYYYKLGSMIYIVEEIIFAKKLCGEEISYFILKYIEKKFYGLPEQYSLNNIFATLKLRGDSELYNDVWNKVTPKLTHEIINNLTSFVDQTENFVKSEYFTANYTPKCY